MKLQLISAPTQFNIQISLEVQSFSVLISTSYFMFTDKVGYSLIFLDRYTVLWWSTVDSTVISLAAELAEKNMQ